MIRRFKGHREVAEPREWQSRLRNRLHIHLSEMWLLRPGSCSSVVVNSANRFIRTVISDHTSNSSIDLQIPK
ncbi:hypothetical protein N8T08_006097 [Aspergillus melleus]|uniref:Uncharacterized protein n=1 Tax=Aspergillus melleus TaxID=138277 RepID=A0ACC3B0X3_9EURO|nr:hypothetical protein N8T08_006097 [Aspergillus melleus]